MSDDQSIEEYSHVKEIVLVRHGQTTRNIVRNVGRFVAHAEELHKAGILPDHLVELTVVGKLQADTIGKILNDSLENPQSFIAYYDSGYQRSKETLDYILRNFGLENDASGYRRSHLDLREREPGHPFNMTITQINRYFPWYQEYEKVMGKFYARPPGGESIADVCSRVHMFLNSLRRAKAGKRVFIVAHGRVMLAFRYWLEKMEVRDIEDYFKREEKEEDKIGNCQVFIYKRDDTGTRIKFKRNELKESEVMKQFDKIMRPVEGRTMEGRDQLVNFCDVELLQGLDPKIKELKMEGIFNEAGFN